MKLTNINFHQTFPPEKSMLSRLLTADVYGEELTKEEISGRTGIPTGKSCGKVVPHIAYAVYMGLVKSESNNGKYLLSLTSLGETILNEDPALNEDVTALVCHLRMTSQYGGAPLWETIVSEILPHNTAEVKWTSLTENMQASSDVKLKFSPFFTSYENEFFSQINIIKRVGDILKVNKHVYNNDFAYVYAYALFREWENMYPRQNELTAEEIEKLLTPGALGWNQIDTYSAMEKLQDKGLLTFNRQLVPYTVTKHYESERLITNLYSELF